MHIKTLQLIPAILVFLCCGCKSTSLNETSRLPNIPERNISAPIEPPLPLEQTEPSTPEAEFWDTSDVDVSDVNPNKKLIAFTFDDAPGRTMENILAVFAQFNEKNPDCKASATFFFNGGLLDSQTQHLLYAANALDFELGNHTQSHRDLTTLSEAELTREIDLTDRLLQSVDGKPRHLLRAPFGRINARIKELAPVPLIDWTIDTLDWTGVSAEEIYDEVFRSRFSGAIVLMHDGYEHTVSALKRLLPDLKKDGYQVVSLSKMIKAHGCTFRRGSVYIRARKQN